MTSAGHAVGLGDGDARFPAAADHFCAGKVPVLLLDLLQQNDDRWTSVASRTVLGVRLVDGNGNDLQDGPGRWCRGRILRGSCLQAREKNARN
ncbi:hypothetical protein LIP_0433 [Limnochorda pilosa]|uniref:Uncharacterized protein n=1 Tax=Limnochorda pilosa TaxID=1555112 RepID=A0A0K2SGS4_LIMPI|nr:hypothetical protein LIP_0433 [Limnochorda pilosa]